MPYFVTSEKKGIGKKERLEEKDVMQQRKWKEGS